MATCGGKKGNYSAGKLGGSLGKYMKGAGADAGTRYGLELLGNFYPGLISNGISNSASENTSDAVEKK